MADHKHAFKRCDIALWLKAAIRIPIYQAPKICPANMFSRPVLLDIRKMLAVLVLRLLTSLSPLFQLKTFLQLKLCFTAELQQCSKLASLEKLLLRQQLNALLIPLLDHRLCSTPRHVLNSVPVKHRVLSTWSRSTRRLRSQSRRPCSQCHHHHGKN